jgi:hypothetical protein
MAQGICALAAPPRIVAPADTRPNRGDAPDSPRITGPTTPIHTFYNEDTEISFWSGPAAMAFSLAKNDVWDRRYFGRDKRLITLEDVRRVCFAPGAAEGGILPANGPHGQDLGLSDAPHALYLAYDFPCPKPVGQIILRCPDLEGEADWQAGRSADNSLAVSAARGDARVSFSAFVHRTRNLLVIQGEYSGLTRPLEVQLYRHQDTTPEGTSIPGMAHYGGDTGYDYSQDRGNGPLPAPESGTDRRSFWVRQRFHPEPTFPQGFEVVMAATLAGAPYETAAQDHVVGAGVSTTIHPADPEPVGWLREIRLTARRMNETPFGSLASATLTGASGQFTLYVATATTRDAADPLAAARELLADALARGPEGVAQESLSATKADLRAWRLSRVMHYNATSCTWADQTPWHGDYHWNEVYAGQEIVAGGADSLQQRFQAMEDMLPALRSNARDVYGCRGGAFSLVHYPIKTDTVVYSNVVWEWGLENTALMLQPFWQTFQYTWDLDFLRTRAYPMMLEGARFYADYVQKGDDGYYHVIPTVSQEHWGFTPQWQLNRDSVGALSFVRYHLRACVQASELLGVDAAERRQWQEIVDHLAPYPTLETPEGPVFCDVRDAPELLNYNITANLIMTLWAEDISLDSPPELLELARRSFRAIPDKAQSMRPGYLSQIATFLGIPEHVDLAPMGRVLSWPGRIHLYAGVPAGTSLDDHFSGLLAVGGFEVSAAHVGTDVRSVRITSHAGLPCRLRSPWGVAEVKVIELPGREAVAHSLDGDTLAFATQAGHTYAVLGGPEIGLADQRFVADERVVGEWTFAREEGGVVPDDSGHGHAATFVGGAALAEAEGRQVLRLTGEGAYAQVPRAPAFDFAPNESFALEARVRVLPGDVQTMVPILCSMDLKQYCFTLSEGRLDLYLSSPTGDVNCHVRGDTVVTDGRWHALRAVRDASDGTLRVYVDGQLDGEAPDLTTGDFVTGNPLTIGAYLWGANSRYARADIADVALVSLGKLVAGA